MTAFRISDVGPVDGMGRRSFTLHWNEHLPASTPNTIGRRAQCFRADLDATIRDLRKRGHVVTGEHATRPHRFRCHCCGADYHTTAPQDPRRDAGYGTCERCIAWSAGRRADVPPCAAAMGCLCAGHARGNSASEACDTTEG